jgi:serine/threonine-protein kinase
LKSDTFFEEETRTMGAVHKGSPVRALGRYELHGELASGGMATVHVGRLVGEAGFARTVAIKRLHAHLAKDPDFVAMFVDEARLAARVRHPNVVPTLDVISEDEEIFLVMEYVAGESLSRLARILGPKKERVPADIAVSLLVGVLHGLHAAHEAKSEKGVPLEIVHRDVSPQNVLVGADGSAHVLDFGVAKAVGRAQTTREGQIKGKLGYVAPEQLGDGIVSRQSDVYAAAVVLWETLTGKRLFDADNEGAVLVKVIEAKVAAPSTLVAGLPPKLDEIVLRGLDKYAERRWPTAREFALALEKTGRMASPSEIAEWLQSVAGDDLARRARKVAEVERGSVRMPSAAASDPQAIKEDSVSGVRLGEGASAVSSVSVSRSEQVPAATGRGRSGAMWIAGAAVCVLGVGVFLSLRAPRSAYPPPLPAATVAAPGAPLDAPTATTAATDTPTEPVAVPPATGTVVDAPPSSSALPTVKAPVVASPPRPAARGAKAHSDCDPPFTTDAQGHKHYKLQCL